MDFSNLYFVGLFCPNCGRKIIGYKSNDGALRVSCPKCDVKLFSKQRNRREMVKNFEIPPEQIDAISEIEKDSVREKWRNEWRHG